MTMAYDPTGVAYLMPNQQPSQAQRRYMAMWEMVNKNFKGEDQYVVVTPSHGPSAVKVVTSEQAAQMIYDGQARLANPDEVEEFKMNDELSRQEVEKDLAKKDVVDAMRRMTKD